MAKRMVHHCFFRGLPAAALLTLGLLAVLATPAWAQATFGGAQTFGSGGSAPTGITRADFDGDTDLAVANQSSNVVSILLNNGSGSYSVNQNVNSNGSTPT